MTDSWTGDEDNVYGYLYIYTATGYTNETVAQVVSLQTIPFNSESLAAKVAWTGVIQNILDLPIDVPDIKAYIVGRDNDALMSLQTKITALLEVESTHRVKEGATCINGVFRPHNTNTSLLIKNQHTT